MDNHARIAHPLLYEVHTRDWLSRFSDGVRLCQLDELPDHELDRIAGLGFNWIWLLGIWQTGPLAADISRNNPAWRLEYQESLSGFKEQDITGSTFAIDAYQVHRDFGGPNALGVLRKRLTTRGIRLLLDFVPNHTAPDHPWVHQHPDYYVNGTESDLAREPNNFVRLDTGTGRHIFARGRDPYFPAWPDTLQLNYGNPALQAAMTDELKEIAGQCDGVRCDMAMLILPEVFRRTWAIDAHPFWPSAIAAVHQLHPRFLFMAEVYWGLDRQLQELGFDYTYDKSLYDLLLQRNAKGIQAHLAADASFIGKSVHFLENHDEARIATQLPLPVHQAAAAITFLLPGMCFFHDGQLEGLRRKPSIHLARRMDEPTDPDLQSFYLKLLQILQDQVVSGDWLPLHTVPAWQGNPSDQSFVTFGWFNKNRVDAILAVNYADHRSQCYVLFPARSLAASENVILENLLGPEHYERSSEELQRKGFYMDVDAWSTQLFAFRSDT
ncbi:MAG TPA: alpha-amylase family glycosyl hydrolase [Bryobacteraceae bacterium]|nr:alpha-amylase family glycosyl hydrolase [Bryobacteraceae bacterium]